ncbi:hypothetical protein [Pelagicoccus mobilis]|uniref:Lipoprotein n=1 Tax=Pelagicoccus mobilis TaxID=415221 RepID=A0A934RXR0_9BACT|nr:hypothetical protein [Pelagicoccus mobilis]MBK1876751.1 hypothetical protein [Pelagicoccus mobilis]
MNSISKILTFTALGSIALTGCSKKEEITEADVQAAADKAAQEAVAASEKKNDDKMAAMKAESDKKLADAKAEMEAKLAAETKLLKEQFTASNAALRKQYDSLKSKYDSVKSKLPEDIVSQVSSTLPDLANSLGNLESIANTFTPSTLEQLNELKTKYEKELAVAKGIADQILKMLGKGSLESMLPKL